MAPQLRRLPYDEGMSEPGEYHLTEDIYWEVFYKREDIDRQLRFALQLWHQRNENYERVSEAVRQSTLNLRKYARTIQDEEDRRDSLRNINRILSVLSFHDEYAPYVEGSGGQRPGRPRHKVESVTSAGLPGHGKRR